MPVRLFRGSDGAASMCEYLPPACRDYIRHARDGLPIRAIARENGVPPSTVLRRVRRIEAVRSDPFIDGFLSRMERKEPVPDIAALHSSARRVLRRLMEKDAVLVAGAHLPQAVVVRDSGDGPVIRLATLPTEHVAAMAVCGWIVPMEGGSRRLARYRISAEGRRTLDELLARQVRERWCRPGETPLAALSRRRALDGRPLFSPRQVSAGEMLRHDREVGRLDAEHARRFEAARNAVPCPRLARFAVAVCCDLVGVETAERRFGYSARSGKHLLPIALETIANFYGLPPDAEEDSTEDDAEIVSAA